MKTLASTLFASVFLMGCSASHPEMQARTAPVSNQVKTGAVSTVKPGAAMEFAHKVEGEVVVGQFSDIIVTAEGDVEALSLSANGTDNLEVGAISALSFGKGEAPSWRISVRPKTDGVHYLNLFAVARTGIQDLEKARIQSIRIDLGGEGPDLNADQKPTIVQSDEGAVAVFKAEETSER